MEEYTGYSHADSIYFARENLDFLFNILMGYDFYIAGGFVTRCIYKYLHNKDFINPMIDSQDIDIFSENSCEAERIRNKLLSAGAELKEKNKVSLNEKLIYNGIKIDLIFANAFLGNPLHRIQYFDMSQCAFMIAYDKAYYLENSMECIENSKIKLNFVNNTHFDIKRIYKYKRRGFKLDSEDLKFIESNEKNGQMQFNVNENYYGNTDAWPCGIYPNKHKDVIKFVFDGEILENISGKNSAFSGYNGIMHW